jgi:periplasmic glucans biosynthesis protein
MTLRSARLTCWVALCLFAGAARAAETLFDFEVLRYRAKMLATKPYVTRVSTVPEKLRKLNYEQHRFIAFNPAQSWWRRDGLPFQLQFFHPGFIFDKTVQIHEVRGREEQLIPFSAKFFNYGIDDYGEIPENMGFSGFRLLYNLNHPQDELGAFQGASYFRLLCMKAVYGLSARGLAINTGEAGGEEFPTFEEFWVQRPSVGDKQIVIFALLDSPSIAGAYRFTIQPGEITVAQVKAVLYARTAIKTLGIAPLTSMFWHGENSDSTEGDYRPEVHDSDGLLVNHSNGEWLWRPLTNPASIRTVAFSDQNPRGFGLLQRDRRFDDYQDLEVAYQARPSAWVEPVGDWGRGSVRLVELHTPNETNDNIVAFWAPDSLPAVGEPIEFEYKLKWFMDQIRPPAGYVVATRRGTSKTHDTDLQHFWVDFDGPYLGKQGPDPAIEPVVDVGAGAKLSYVAVQKNPYNGTWRIAFGVRPDGSKKPVELRCFLRKAPHVLTETWSYLWQP